ncbi:MAG TPA: alpha/beta fold hydrolase [Ktedonobacterales bacterium]
MGKLLIGLGAAAGVIAMACLALISFSYRRARTLVTPQRKPLQIDPASLRVPLEHVCFPGPRGALAAWYLPASNGCTLVCCHGIDDNSGQWFAQMEALHLRSGYGALMFDFAGHGQSEGTLVTYGAAEQEDVAAAMSYLGARGDVDMERLGLMGLSLGAITGTLFAARKPVFRVVVIESGFADLQRDIAHLFHRYTGLPAFPFANLIVAMCQRITGTSLSSIRPMRVIHRISPAAVLIISDLADTIADEPFDGEHLFAAADEPKELWQLDGVDHVQAFPTFPHEWVERVGSFLDRYLGALSHA